jgi:hypothetical protein
LRVLNEDGSELFDDSSLLMDVVQAVLSRHGSDRWEVVPGEFWCTVTPVGYEWRDEGWKLHVSATQLAAPIVLARAAEVLVRHGCAYRFAVSLEQAGELVSRRCDRGRGGKFITAYPTDDAQFQRLADALDRATTGLPGPAILSDRPLRPGSLVHYRYGAFAGLPVLTNDGTFEPRLAAAPEGIRIDEEHAARFVLPRWTPRAPEPAAAAPVEPEPVLIGGRFLVQEAIRHAYRGGVYRAIDQATGAEVVLKQARPHVASHLTGKDAQDALRHEAEMLELLSELALAPRKVALFAEDESLFLAEELVPGATLRQWTAERVTAAWHGQGPPPAEALELARELLGVVSAVHDQGLVLRDLTPNNVMVTPDGCLQLIDPEHVTRAGARVVRAYTPGYAAPEQLAAPGFGPAPAQSADLFSLGATIFHLASGAEPALLADEPEGRPLRARLGRLTALIAVQNPAVRLLAPAILGLMDDDPAQRWSLEQARAFLAAPHGLPRTGVPSTGLESDRLPDADADELLANGLTHVLRTMTPERPRLWKSGAFGATTDPCNVQHGAAGVLSVLTRAAAVFGGDRLRGGVAAIAEWMDPQLFEVPRILPGLYFGRAGVAWSLFDAAKLVKSERLAGRAIDLAKRVPLEWPNPDICHGLAGAGMAQLHLWQATGDRELERRTVQCADAVLAAAREQDGQLVWPIPDTFDSKLAGLVHYGFGHGVAGAGAFLLYAGLATGRSEYLDAARRAGDTLEAVAAVEGDAAWWPDGPESTPETARLRHWCSGSSGVGTFLIRLWLATGERRFRDLAEAGAVAVRHERWRSPAAACHGLAGDGDFLLDLADLTGEPCYRGWAEELAAAIHARATYRDGLLVVGGENQFEVTADYSTGVAGVVGFLLRLRHGGNRLWMPDVLLNELRLRTAQLVAAAV